MKKYFKTIIKRCLGIKIYSLFTNYLDIFILGQRRVRYWKHRDTRTFSLDWKKYRYNRISVLNLLAREVNAGSYLEIGCSSNITFDSIPIDDKTGVDPYHGGTVRLTSDEFFNKNHRNFDLIFIDGDHDYQQARKDFLNSIKVLNSCGFIVLHDMLPNNWLESHVPILTRQDWTGDVWRLAFEILRYPSLEFRIIKVDQGVGVVKVRDNTVKFDIAAPAPPTDFGFYYDNIRLLPVLEWEEAVNWIKSLRF